MVNCLECDNDAHLQTWLKCRNSRGVTAGLNKTFVAKAPYIHVPNADACIRGAGCNIAIVVRNSNNCALMGCADDRDPVVSEFDPETWKNFGMVRAMEFIGFACCATKH